MKNFLMFVLALVAAGSTTLAQDPGGTTAQCDAVNSAARELVDRLATQRTELAAARDRRARIDEEVERLDRARPSSASAGLATPQYWLDYTRVLESRDEAMLVEHSIHRKAFATMTALQSVAELLELFCSGGGDAPPNASPGARPPVVSGTAVGTDAADAIDGRCRWTDVERDTSFDGDSIKSVGRQSLSQCKTECEKLSECKSVIFDPKGGWCYLRAAFASDRRIVRENLDYYECREDAAPPTLPPDTPFRQLPPPGDTQVEAASSANPTCRWAEPQRDRSFDGKNMASLRKVSIDHCKVACEENDDCRSVIYDRAGSWCYLRDTVATALRQRSNLDYYVPLNCP